MQDLIQDSLGLFDGHSLICCNTPCFYWKASSWSKDNKDGNLSQHNCCLISVLQSSGRNFLHPGCARKQVTNMTGQLSLTSFLRYCNDIAKNCWFFFCFFFSGGGGGGGFGHAVPHTPKMIITNWGNIWRVSTGKKPTSSITCSLSYFFIADILWTCFGYFRHARQCTPKVILSFYRKLSCLSKAKKSTLSSMLF